MSTGFQRASSWSVLVLVWCVSTAQAELFEFPVGDNVVGSSYEVVTRYGETTPMLAQLHEVGYHELLWANPEVHSWMPGEGVQIHIPRRYVLPGKTRTGIVLNLPEMRLYYYEPGEEGSTEVYTYPVSIGRMDWVTPIGNTKVTDRVENPNWYPPASIRLEHELAGDPLPAVVPPGPDNPLGRYAMALDVPGYLIHGTNRNQGIGMRVTHGCIRLRSGDIAELVRRVEVNTEVQIISIPVKVGLLDSVVYLEAHPPPIEGFPLQEKEPLLDESEVSLPLTALEEQLEPGSYVIYWDQVMEAMRELRGVPVAVGWAESLSPAPSGRPELLWRQGES